MNHPPFCSQQQGQTGLFPKNIGQARERPDGRGPARVARLTRTPPENRGPDHGRLSACELAVGDAPRDVTCGGEQVAHQSATPAGRSGDAGAHCPLLGIVESPLRREGRHDSQQCHPRRPPDRRATPATRTASEITFPAATWPLSAGARLRANRAPLRRPGSQGAAPRGDSPPRLRIKPALPCLWSRDCRGLRTPG